MTSEYKQDGSIKAWHAGQQAYFLPDGRLTLFPWPGDFGPSYEHAGTIVDVGPDGVTVDWRMI